MRLINFVYGSQTIQWFFFNVIFDKDVDVISGTIGNNDGAVEAETHPKPNPGDSSDPTDAFFNRPIDPFFNNPLFSAFGFGHGSLFPFDLPQTIPWWRGYVNKLHQFFIVFCCCCSYSSSIKNFKVISLQAIIGDFWIVITNCDQVVNNEQKRKKNDSNVYL